MRLSEPGMRNILSQEALTGGSISIISRSPLEVLISVLSKILSMVLRTRIIVAFVSCSSLEVWVVYVTISMHTRAMQHATNRKVFTFANRLLVSRRAGRSLGASSEALLGMYMDAISSSVREKMTSSLGTLGIYLHTAQKNMTHAQKIWHTHKKKYDTRIHIAEKTCHTCSLCRKKRVTRIHFAEKNVSHV